MKKFFLLLLAAAFATTVIQASPSSMGVTTNAPVKAPAEYTELNYAPASWNEAPDMKFYGSSSKVEVSGSSILMSDNGNVKISMIAEFTCTKNSVFTFEAQKHYSSPAPTLRVYCDGELNKIISPETNYIKHFINLETGEHQIIFEIDGTTSNYIYIRELGIVPMPLISVELYEPGSLGTEILYNDVERLQDVRNLKIKGTLNDDDVDKLKMMKDNLVRLDLSEANLTTIRKELFYNALFLNTVILPQNLISIGDEAFYRCPIEHIDFPETLESIGQRAFNYSSLKEAIMPDATTNLGENAFAYCYYLETVRLSNNLTALPDRCFYYCNSLQNFTLPNSLKTIGDYAFGYCYYINMELPVSLKSIGQGAFCETNQRGTIKATLTIPEGCSINYASFNYTNYTTAILPTSFTSVTTTLPSTIQKIKLKSATVVLKDNNTYSIVSDNQRANVTLEVPSYLVNSYKLHSYWYNFKEIIGFDTDEIDFWNVKADLVLNARDRMLGTPSIDIANTGSIKINGSDAMPLNNLHIHVYNDYYISYSKFGRIFSNADGVTIAGDLSIDMYLDYEKTWIYITLPFDIKVDEIQHLDGGLFAVRYYDGANRALNGATGSWTNYADDAVIPAGTGFIVNVSKVGTLRFTALDNDSKQFITANRMFVKPLEANPSDVASNRGWNLVGNPYQCFYNLHKLNFTAPITVRNTLNNKYEAYSIIDDDYALRPNQAFFVQCPDGVSAITFPLDGRQMSEEILSQQGAPAKNPHVATRRLTDIMVSCGNDTDNTRVVLNEDASTEYELACDASKFLSDNESAVQLYTIEDDEYYAINERPALDGKVKLGFIAGIKGEYTISIVRNGNEHVYLTDLATGIETEISADAYTFESEPGVFDNRFVISIENGTSLISSVGEGSVDVKAQDGKIGLCGSGIVEIYNLAGVKLVSTKVSGDEEIDVAPGIYIVKTDKGVVKVSVK